MIMKLHPGRSHGFAQTVFFRRHMAKSLGMQVVAEGVEDGAHWAALERMGCDFIQGYLFSPPVSPEDFAKLLRQQGQSN